MVKVIAINICDELDEKTYEKLLKAVSDEKREKISRFHFKMDKLRSLYGDILVRSQAIQRLGITNKEIIFVSNDYGKPSIIGVPNFHFNISHSGQWVVGAFGEKEVGIDVEQIKPIEMDIAKRFFSPKEYKDLLSKSDEERINYFFDLWTLKESYIKWVGKGLSIPLSSFSFSENQGIYSVMPKVNDNLEFKQYHLGKEYKISVCAEENCAAEILHNNIHSIAIN